MAGSAPDYMILVSGLVGALSGAVITWRVGVHTAQISRTIELYKEFNSSAMGQSRIDAYGFLRSSPAVSFDEYNQLSEAKPLWEVVYFYQRLSQMLTRGLLLKRVVPGWFGETFVWWYEYSCRHELKAANWQGYRDVNRLYVWLERRATRRAALAPQVPAWIADYVSISKAEWTEWHARGTDARSKHWRSPGSADATSNEEADRPDTRGCA